MNDLEYVKRMCAEANLRYSVTVTNEGSTVVINGRRDQHPAHACVIELQFSTEGRMTGGEGREA